MMGGSTAVWAQTNGYNRLVNVASGHVAHLENTYKFSPDVTREQALSLPGTIAHITFEDGVMTSLKAQNIDLVNVVIPTLKATVPQLITEEVFASLKDSLASLASDHLSGTMGRLFVGHLNHYSYDDFLTYIDEIDTNFYMEPAEGGYYLYIESPRYPFDAGDFTAYFTKKLNDYLDLYRGTAQSMAMSYLVGREQMIPMVNSLISNFLFDDRLYLTEQVDEDYGTQFGFANNSNYKNSDVKALWQFVPVDDTNYFGIKGQYQDDAGKWWASMATDFPMQLADGMTAYVVNHVVDAGKSEIQRVKVSQKIIPAMTPVILELNGDRPEQNVVQVLENDAPAIQDNALCLATDSLGFLLGKELPTIDRHYYVLGVMEGKACLVETENTFLNPNEAFFYLDDERKGQNITGYLTLADNVSGIAEVMDSTRHDGKYYDLQGREVSQPQRGLYIHNGKKIVVR